MDEPEMEDIDTWAASVVARESTKRTIESLRLAWKATSVIVSARLLKRERTWSLSSADIQDILANTDEYYRNFLQNHYHGSEIIKPVQKMIRKHQIRNFRFAGKSTDLAVRSYFQQHAERIASGVTKLPRAAMPSGFNDKFLPTVGCVNRKHLLRLAKEYLKSSRNAPAPTETPAAAADVGERPHQAGAEAGA
ncbi:uncharacterized protein AMSG_05398 [Thecamonas trahens ATCC 50062]|uniref:Uncharacterized protein n=1 Tax=Thecamonas trahens ATCC 50062 TaxID=461836 RepID=A0A0L0DAM9_THETB|nr:hypothetical protein AMSG_05398 [Thecamonas trahens ATCC 50062]KNC49397.1 hypothetical protein AMSG_05398 [Thecamonas trahens ATCC 50062]|eukprot:XP_013757821.1 hypothetical protein AMSG_05398 [Thecamonas trahens ATCC 50062]